MIYTGLSMANDQQAYFDQAHHRFPTSSLLSESPAQQAEVTMLTHALNLPQGSQVIDFGAGNGRITFPFLKLRYQVLAVDISSQSLAELDKLKPKGALTLSTHIPDKPCFDGVVGADILHHVDLPETLPRLYQALRPGGRVAFSEPNAWYLPWYFYLWFNRIPWSIEKNIIHNNLIYLKQSFTAAGFTDIHFTGHGFMPTTFNSQPWNYTLGKFLTPFAFRLIISATKP
jgi:2-polyprenyl-3-methyl-5-hydroxy-6-metoxy-1,4-benzoquinol methylase